MGEKGCNFHGLDLPEEMKRQIIKADFRDLRELNGQTLAGLKAKGIDIRNLKVLTKISRFMIRNLGCRVGIDFILPARRQSQEEAEDEDEEDPQSLEREDDQEEKLLFNYLRWRTGADVRRNIYRNRAERGELNDADLCSLPPEEPSADELIALQGKGVQEESIGGLKELAHIEKTNYGIEPVALQDEEGA